MNYSYLAIGILIFAVTAVDIVKTTLSSKGGGLVTTLISRFVWNVFFALSGKKGRSRFLSYAGTVILVSVLLFWVVGLWIGLFLMLLSDPESVVNSTTMVRADTPEKLYYAGFTLSTLGTGDYVAATSAWRIVSSIAAFSGLAFITASITYFVPVLQAVELQSKFSLYVKSMGNTPQQVLINSWNGNDFSSFFERTDNLCQMLMQHTLDHHSYPVIHFFHNRHVKLAIVPSIVMLSEIYHLLKYQLTDQDLTDSLKMNMLRVTIDSYLEMVKSKFVKDADPQTIAPAPDLTQLKLNGIPVQEEAPATEKLSNTAQKRRQLLTTLLERDGWIWKDIYNSN